MKKLWTYHFRYQRSGSGGGQGTCFSLDKGKTFKLGTPFSLPCAPEGGRVVRENRRWPTQADIRCAPRLPWPQVPGHDTIDRPTGHLAERFRRLGHNEMPDPRSKGSTLRWQSNGRKRIVASNSASLSARVNETLSRYLGRGPCEPARGKTGAMNNVRFDSYRSPPEEASYSETFKG